MECSGSAILGDAETSRQIKIARIDVCIFIVASFALFNQIRRHIAADGSDHAEEQEVQPYDESYVDDDANVKQNIK